jgi:IPT/TIG domain
MTVLVRGAVNRGGQTKGTLHMRVVRLFRMFGTVASAGLLAGAMTVALEAGGSAPAGAVPTPIATCTFNGVANNGLVKNISPGSSLNISCSGLPDSTSVVVAEASALAGLLPSSQAIDEADTSALKFAESSATGTLSTTFTIPTTFAAADSNAKCPLTTAQVNAGLTGCAVAVAELSGTDFGDALLDYTSQPAPASPTLALGSSTAHAGDEVSVTDGAGPGNWWGNAFDNTDLNSSDIAVHGVQSGATTASVSAATYSIKVSKSGKVSGQKFTPPKLGGDFVVPCGVTGAQSVAVTEPNTSLIAGTVSASASLTVLPGTTPAITSISPTRGPSGGGNEVTIDGCNFTGATAVDFGTKAATNFTVTSDSSITAVAPAGTGTVNIVVHKGGATSTTSLATQYTYGFQGYDMVGGDGGVFAFGDAKDYGSLPGLGIKPNAPVVGEAVTTTGLGYYLAGADGGVFAFGDAKSEGSLPGLGVTPSKPIVGIGSPFTGGYWLVGSDGGVYAFGNVKYYGSLPGLGITPTSPIVGIAPTSDGLGYWLVGANGGVYAFGDAKYWGSLPGLGVTPAAPIAGITSNNDNGYLLVGADGGTFAFGVAKSEGSLPGLGVTPNKPIIGIVYPDEGGYWMIGADGGVYSFGDAKYMGSLPGIGVTPAAAITGTALA